MQTWETVLQEYQRKLSGLRTDILYSQAAESRFVLLSGALTIGAAAGMIALASHNITAWYPVLLAPVAVWSFRKFLRQRQESSSLVRLRRFYDLGVDRLNGTWTGKGVPGDEFSRDGHVYEADLNILGQGSMFELLCTARTGLGKRRLAAYLLDPPQREESLARQASVKELASRSDLREKIAVLGSYSFKDCEWEPFHNWLESPPLDVPRPVPWVVFFLSFAIVPLLLSLLVPSGEELKTRLSPVLFTALTLQACGLLLRSQIQAALEGMRSIGHDLELFRQGLELLEGQKFESAKLIGLVESVKGASGKVRRLERLIRAIEECNADWLYLPARLFLLPTQLALAVERWKTSHAADLRGWLDAWSEFEALNALGTYGNEHPEDVFPDIVDAAEFNATGLSHPLLPEEAGVRNDVELGGGRRFYLVSGSNMAGKSTFLRAIGLNAVLASAGAPVRARKARLACFTVCASVSVVDSLAAGKSKFMAEVERLREMLRSSAGPNPVLFVIDEILSGTNSHDRRVAAESFVRALIETGAVGALSTHDLALAEIADAAGLGGINVHMESRDSADPFAFDYLLKPGVSTHSNALAIARLAGVAV